MNTPGTGGVMLPVSGVCLMLRSFAERVNREGLCVAALLLKTLCPGIKTNPAKSSIIAGVCAASGRNVENAALECPFTACSFAWQSVNKANPASSV